MKTIRCLAACAVMAAAPLWLLTPEAAQAQTVNPYLPLTTKPRRPANPLRLAQPGPATPRDGVIKPPQISSPMTVIAPRTPSRLPVFPPPGTPGSSPSVIPK